tara:strand:- start:9287 stop:9685 length:399 start_codon:yes stop_codon:yes gene_type:complete
MDGDWGNILYFVLMALFVIFGALKKKKPVNNPQANSDIQSEGEMPSSVENIFNSLLGGDAFQDQQVHPYQVIQEEIVEEEIVDLPRKEMKIESVKYSSPILMEVDEAEDGDNIEFDWKQAIISKEILDRKYI